MALISNKKAHILYTITDSLEAGIELFGHEVKSIKKGQGSLEAAKVIIRGGEAFLVGAFIPPYQQANTPSSYDPYRTRRLLLHTSEIAKIIGTLGQTPQLTVTVLSFYISNNRIKAELALCKGKNKADKRHDIRAKEESLRLRRIKHFGFDE